MGMCVPEAEASENWSLVGFITTPRGLLKILPSFVSFGGYTADSFSGICV